MTDILDTIDQAIGCQQCGRPLGDSPSADRPRREAAFTGDAASHHECAHTGECIAVVSLTGQSDYTTCADCGEHIQESR